MHLSNANPTVTHSTFVIERTYAAPPGRVFAAFAEPGAKRAWFVAERGMDVEEFTMDFRAGGHERTAYRFQEGTPFPGLTMVNETTYLDIVADRRIVMAYSMSMGGNRISSSLATVEFLAAEGGTTLLFTDQGAYFEGADGPEIRKEGWSSLLAQLDGVMSR